MCHIRIDKENTVDLFQNFKNKIKNEDFQFDFINFKKNGTFLQKFEFQEIVYSFYNLQSTFELIQDKKEFILKKDFIIGSIFERILQFLFNNNSENFIEFNEFLLKVENFYSNILKFVYEFKLDLLVKFFNSKSIEFVRSKESNLFENKLVKIFPSLFSFIKEQKKKKNSDKNIEMTNFSLKKKLKEKQEILFQRIKKKLYGKDKTQKKNSKNVLKTNLIKKKTKIKTEINDCDIQCIICQENIDSKTEYSIVFLQLYNKNLRTNICSKLFGTNSSLISYCKFL